MTHPMNTPRTALEDLDRIADRMDAESSDDMPMQFAGMPSIYADIRKWAKDIRTHGKALSEALDNDRRWRIFASSPQTALMLGASQDPNEQGVDWLTVCNTLADRFYPPPPNSAKGSDPNQRGNE